MRHSKRFYIILVTILFAANIFATTTFSSTGLILEDEGADKTEIVEKTVVFLKERKPGIPEDRIKIIANSVYEESRKYDLDYRLVLAIMKVESNFKNEAVSRRGARGLMQIKPSSAKIIARESGVEVKGAKCLHEPEKNIKIGVSYLSKLHAMFDNMVSALHAYNAGPGKVKKPATQETAKTTSFTRKVMSEYRQITEVLPEADED
ncbi:MAG: lytic transglycosylase domain-containing protein [Syntrophorhabdaceae bacterium]|nr:lytic transglycosylase domain-containing protein [Syntrophorhabdaceae bacterium]